MSQTSQSAALVAIAAAVAPKDIKAAKQALPEQSSVAVDLTVRIRGTVTKGTDEPAASGESPAAVDLLQRTILLDAIHRLGVTPAKLRRALRAAHKSGGAEHRELGEAIEQLATELAADLPPVNWMKAGKAAAVRLEGGSYQILNA